MQADRDAKEQGAADETCCCYRTKDQDALKRELLLTVGELPDWDDRFNIAPGQLAPVVIATPEGHACQLMLFGLIPYAARGVPPSHSTINARAENLSTNPTWRSAWQRKQRCLVLASEAYGWHLLLDRKTKQPYLLGLADQASFAMAGLWDRSKRDDGTLVLSFAIVTIPVSRFMKEAHHLTRREPAILTREGYEPWLGGTNEAARAVLKPYPEELLTARAVSTSDCGP